MSELKPWAYGPFELISHAEGHFKGGSDFDKRISLISFDNAIEVAITTYLRLHPKQRGGTEYPKDQIEKWQANYHSKLAFFAEHLQRKKLLEAVKLDEIIWYHNLRNELYHAGGGFVPNVRDLTGAREAALWVFSVLFDADAKYLVESTNPAPIPVTISKTELPAKMALLASFIDFEKALNTVMRFMGWAATKNADSGTAIQGWKTFVSHVGKVPSQYEQIFASARDARNHIVHGKDPQITEAEMLQLAAGLDRISNFISEYCFSLDVLPALRNKYPKWLRQEIISVRLLQKEKTVFLEVVERTNRGRDETVTRTDLSFVSGSDLETSYFSSDNTSQENAEKFVSTFDPIDIINCTNLFCNEFGDEIYKQYGPKSCNKLGLPCYEANKSPDVSE